MSFSKLTGFVSILLFFTLIIGPTDTRAQSYDLDYTTSFINELLDGKCALFVEKKNIRVEYYLNGEAARIDYIFPESIDFETGIYYSESEGAVIISCYEKAGKCIERDILKRDTKLLYDRTNLTTTCTGETCKQLKEAVKHLVKLYVLEDYERTEPF
jgi:hypothetical protein